jgi:hypothetical protein
MSKGDVRGPIPARRVRSATATTDWGLPVWYVRLSCGHTAYARRGEDDEAPEVWACTDCFRDVLLSRTEK